MNRCEFIGVRGDRKGVKMTRLLSKAFLLACAAVVAVNADAADGCHTVAEGDGGGSASMWIGNLPKKLAPRDKNYINRPSDGQPRRLGEGVFVTYEK